MVEELKKMKVLIACEESQRVCIEFRKLGVEAYSCDIQECSGGHPEWHIKGDVLPLLQRKDDGNNGWHYIDFSTMDGREHYVEKWDLIIAHPPCTYLTVAGACNIPKHPERIELGFQSKEFFLKIMDADCERISIENPPPMKRFGLPKYDQLIRPYMFGESNNKPICLWLKNLPPLFATKIVEKDTNIVRWVHKATGQKKSCSKWYNTNTNEHGKHRSKTFQGIAKAMAEQWTKFIKENEVWTK